jgi:hypothetical protein
MGKSMAVAAFLAAGVMLTGCTRKAEEPAKPAATAAAPAAGSTVFEVMNASIIPASNKIWELAGNLYDDKGNLDASQLKDAQWQELKDSADRMGASAKALASATGLKAAPPGTKIQSEGTPGAASAAGVQKALDADPKTFSEHAGKLAAIADEISAAAAAKDAKKTDDAQGRLTDVCGDCHKKFWYPDEAAAK